MSLAPALAAQEERLSHCVHCGFCLPACPTYVRLGDENDSPRGRLHLMRAVVEGRMEVTDPAFLTHIDRCLGCRGCESVCPSGVEYGLLLERARGEITTARGTGFLTSVLLRVFPTGLLLDVGMTLTRLLRVTGIPGLLARVLPSWGPLGTARLGMAMVAGSRPGKVPASGSPLGPGAVQPVAGTAAAGAGAAAGARRRVGMLVGCVQRGLFARVNDATRRVLEVNGFEVVDVPGQGCCGALHAHSGELARAEELARVNLAAFGALELDFIVVNAAGCGAAMRDYHHLLEGDGSVFDTLGPFVIRIRDVSELLAEVGPRPGAPLPLAVALDSPCHLLHAQRVTDAPQRMLAAIPDLEVRLLPNADECCGGAGIYGVTHPELGGRIGADKVREVMETGADGAATGNPGCMMQIGAGLRMIGSDLPVWHPVELLDESYRRAGFYGDHPASA
jgi:glycolate oxidase iron-sulfur subunit